MLENTEVKITDVRVTSNAPYFSNRAVSGKFQKRFTGVQFFELEFSINYMSQDTKHVQKFIAEHQQSKPFEFNMSYLTDYKGSAQGLITASIASAKGARKVTLGAFSGVLEAGTLVQFQNHSKLYTVTEDVQSNGEMKLFPNLRGNVQLGETVKYRNATGRFFMTNENIPMNIQSLSKLDIKATEVL